jgi:AcrR family transcriptional regulator
MNAPSEKSSSRREELLEQSYRYVLANGLTDLSLRPLAAAIGSSPRVLLFLFGSKEALVKAILQRARAEEVAQLAEVRAAGAHDDLAAAARVVWAWLVDAAHRPLLLLWLEVYSLSLADAEGQWSGFAAQTVEDWLAHLAASQPRATSRRREAERTLCLAVLRGALLDLLATGDTQRVTAAVELYLKGLQN